MAASARPSCQWSARLAPGHRHRVRAQRASRRSRDTGHARGEPVRFGQAVADEQDRRTAGAALDEALQAYALRPNHAGIAFEVAAAYAAAGRLDDATRILKLVAEMGIPFRTDDRAELGDCGRKRPACREALAAIEASRAPRTA